MVNIATGAIERITGVIGSGDGHVYFPLGVAALGGGRLDVTKRTTAWWW